MADDRPLLPVDGTDFFVRPGRDATFTPDPDGVVVDQPVAAEDDHGILQTNSFAFRISREMAVEEGLVEPTVDELAALEERHRAFHADQRAAWVAWDAQQAAYAAAVAAASGPLRAVIDLHAPVERGREQVCEGCEFGGYDGAPSEWPCETSRIATGLRLMSRPSMPREWAEGECPPFRSPYPRTPIRDLFPRAFVDLDPIIYGGDGS